MATAATGASALAAPAVLGQTPIKWRLQTYAGVALAEHVIKPSIDAFNKVANGEMVIELYTADQLVPTGELFRAIRQRVNKEGHLLSFMSLMTYNQLSDADTEAIIAYLRTIPSCADTRCGWTASCQSKRRLAAASSLPSRLCLPASVW